MKEAKADVVTAGEASARICNRFASLGDEAVSTYHRCDNIITKEGLLVKALREALQLVDQNLRKVSDAVTDARSYMSRYVEGLRVELHKRLSAECDSVMTAAGGNPALSRPSRVGSGASSLLVLPPTAARTTGARLMSFCPNASQSAAPRRGT